MNGWLIYAVGQGNLVSPRFSIVEQINTVTGLFQKSPFLDNVGHHSLLDAVGLINVFEGI
jgi:hypothetical protein